MSIHSLISFCSTQKAISKYFFEVESLKGFKIRLWLVQMMNLSSDIYLTNSLSQNCLDAILMYHLMYELLSKVNFFLDFSLLVRLFIIHNDGYLFVYVVACLRELSQSIIDL